MKNFAVGVAHRGAGLATGAMQAVVPGGFILDTSPNMWRGASREFLEGKAVGQGIVGAIETAGGAALLAVGAGGEVVTLGAATPVAVPVAAVGAGIAGNGVGNILMAQKTLDKAKTAPSALKATAPYKRPSGSTTPAQRQSVQGKPCVKCGADDGGKRIAGHKEALVKEHHETSTIDKPKMRDVNSVQPECPTCSAKEGADMSRYSRDMNKQFE